MSCLRSCFFFYRYNKNIDRLRILRVNTQECAYYYKIGLIKNLRDKPKKSLFDSYYSRVN